VLADWGVYDNAQFHQYGLDRRRFFAAGVENPSARIDSFPDVLRHSTSRQ
jgi:hypothetical protein